jgi:hypothetical protein
VTKFKYKDRLATCADQPCPNAKYQERACVGYRWVHDPLTVEDFLPPACRPGARKTSSCETYALSFFKSLDDAQERWKNLSRAYDVETLYGTHAVKIEIETQDGRCSPANKRWGHFDLHEYDGNRGWESRAGDKSPLDSAVSC